MSVPVLARSSPQPHGTSVPMSTSQPCDAQWALASQKTGMGEILASSAQSPSSAFQPLLLLTCGCLGLSLGTPALQAHLIFLPGLSLC